MLQARDDRVAKIWADSFIDELKSDLFANMTKIIPEQNRISGAFDNLKVDERPFFLALHGLYHHRDGVKNPDGSYGTIKITPKQLLDTIAYVYLNEDLLMNQVKKIIQQNEEIVGMNKKIVDMLCLPKIKVGDANEPK